MPLCIPKAIYSSIFFLLIRILLYILIYLACFLVCPVADLDILSGVNEQLRALSADFNLAYQDNTDT